LFGSTSAASGHRTFSLRSWLDRNRADFDLLNTHSSTDSWLSALACATMRHAPPIVRTRRIDADWQPPDDAVALRTRYGAHRHHGRSVASPARTRQRRLNGPDDIDPHRHRPRAFRSRRRRGGTGTSRTRSAADARHRCDLRDWKGHEVLFDALARDRAAWSAWNVLIVGDGPYRPHLDEKLAALGATNIVRFTGQQDDVVPWLQAMEIFVLPSWGDEGVPQSLMQAAACGLAAVSTPIGAIAEAVTTAKRA
jgi:glycosyltransferase involved in cell wall biosynthesis